MTGHAEEMQQESQGKRFSARKQVAGNYALVYFLNMPLSAINKLHPFYIEQVQNISIKSIYQ